MPNNLVISEAYVAGNGSTSADYFEIYNPTGAAISGDGKSLQYKSATGASTSGGPVSLAGLTIPAGGYVLVKGTGTADPTLTHDLTAGFNAQGSNAVLLLVNSTTALTDVPKGDSTANSAIIDALGYGTGDVFEGAAETAPSGSVSMSRSATGTDTNNNANDFTQGPPTLKGSTSTPPSGALAATDPGAQTANVGTPFSLQLAATGGTEPRTWTATGLPANGLSISTGGLISGTPTTTGPINVTATVTDSATPAASDDTTFTITVAAAAAVTPIADIQGTAATQGADGISPLDGQTVTTEGVVTGVFTGSSSTNGGIYVQTGGTGGATDATPGASDAIYVFGGNSKPAGVEIGDSVRVTGVVSDFNTLTQITPAAGGVTEIAALPPVTPAAIAYPDNAADREAHESELLAPTGQFTVSNVFNITGGANAFGEIGLAAGVSPLRQPTDVALASDDAGIAAVTADNAARGVALDDGSSINYMTGTNTAQPLPWISGNANPPRVGAPVTFTAPVILDYRNSAWKLQPTARITDSGAGTATFGTDRELNAAPAEVGGDLKISTFNVLNYFPTTGQAHVAAGGTCTYYNDRAGNPIANDTCNPNGPRGAATTASLQRQQDKIVDAINKLGASVVSLEELENSIKMIGQTDRDNAIRTLVTALNTATGATTWAFAPSPAPADMPTPAQEDVIRTGFIYKPADVELVGASMILKDEVNFDNAREPLAQAFKPVGAPDSEAFGVIVNHFKSKGSRCSYDPAPPAPAPLQGNCNPDRVGQAEALVDFADAFATARTVDDVFLVGDFNSYTQEDPMQVLYDAGYANVVSDDATDASYSFGGLAGSLDHVLGNASAVESVTGSDIWEINANESLAYQYSRYNYHGELYHSVSPWSSSDHNPEIVGINTGDAEPATRDIQILATNDFHGRLLNNQAGAPGQPSSNTAGGPEAGAAVLAGAVKQLRAANPDTVFAAAGDLIGASTFESFIQDDIPTIDALNEAGLEVSAAGNHEFDQGYEDLVGRVKTRAEWEYIAANVEEPNGRDDLADSYFKDFGSVRVGFVGAVTEDLPTLVNPAGIEGVTVTDIVTATNAEADRLAEAGADIIILLVHEGAPGTSLADSTTNPNAFSDIVNGVNSKVDAIVSGHTHLAYNHEVTVPAWVTEGRAVTTRPVVSAGQYGSALNQLTFTVDTATGDVTAKTQALLPLKGPDPDGSGPLPFPAPNYPADPAVTPIVQDAIDQAAVLGAEVLGQTGGPFFRAKTNNPAATPPASVENRGGESTLGNLVAEIQRWATRNPESGAAKIAFMNPGGLRTDLVGNVNGNVRNVTFRQAAEVQPFANTLVNMDLTGAQIETALEQQWQPAGSSRPFLKLGISKGFTYTYTPPPAGSAAGTKGEVTAMYLDGDLIDDADVLSVTVNSFLASGGDAFAAFNSGAGKQDTGKSDLQAQVDYFAEFADVGAGDPPLPVDYSQRAVGVTYPADQPAAIPPGGTVAFDLTSLSMTGRASANAPADVTDTEVTVSADGVTLGTFPVTTTYQTALPGFDEVGTASVSITVPPTAAPGSYPLVVTGNNTGTEVQVPITVTAAPVVETTVTGTAADVVYGQAGSVEVTVTPASGDAAPSGTVTLSDGDTALGTGTLSDGKATIAIPAQALAVGPHELQLSYAGDAGFGASEGTVDVTVVKATARIATSVVPGVVEVGKGTTRIVVAVRATGYQPSGVVEIRYGSTVLGRGTINEAGNAVVNLGPYTTVGTFPLTAAYLGDASATAAAASLSVRVTKQAPVVRVTAPKTVKKNARPTVRVAVSATNVPVAGPVRFQFNGRTVTRNVAANGTAQFQLPKLGKNTTVRVTYLGNAQVQAAVRTVTIKVTR